MFRELLIRVNELKGSETDRFLKFLAILNCLIEREKIGRIIIVGGFAAEIYSGRSYRTGDVDIIVEGNSEIVKEILKKISDKGLRIYIPKIREISEKGIDIVDSIYSGERIRKIEVDNYHVYIASAEDIVINYLQAWKFWESTEDKIKAILVYCAQDVDEEYLNIKAKQKSVMDYLEKIRIEYCRKTK